MLRGNSGSGADQLQNAQGIFVDPQSRVFAADEFNLRIVPVDDMSGAGWTAMGSGMCSAGVGGFCRSFESNLPPPPAILGLEGAVIGLGGLELVEWTN